MGKISFRLFFGKTIFLVFESWQLILKASNEDNSLWEVDLQVD